MTNTNMFPDVIGQNEAKNQLQFYLDSYNHTRFMPNLLFSGQKGGGKSLLATEVGKNLLEFDDNGKPIYKENGTDFKKKPWIMITGSMIESFRWFKNAVLEPHCVGKPSTVFIDECHDMKGDVINNLLVLLAPNAENRNSLVFDDYNIELDFRLNTFIFATTDVEQMNQPLVNRLERIDLSAYSNDDLAKIVSKSSPQVIYEDGVLEEIATAVRQNARDAVQMASRIKMYLKNNTKFGQKHWEDLKKKLSIYPLGLNRREIEILSILNKRPDGTSLNNLSSKTGLSKDAIMKDYERMLMQHSLMEVCAGKGRIITNEGKKYLSSLEVGLCQA